MIGHLRRTTDAPISYDAATYALRIGDGSADRWMLHLGNFYAQFSRLDRKERDVFVESMIASHTQDAPTPATFETARPHLLPIVRNRCYQSFSRLTGLANGFEIPNLEFARVNQELAIGLVIDTPDKMLGLTSESRCLHG